MSFNGTAPATPDSDAPLLGRETFLRRAGILLAFSPLGNFLLAAASSGVAQWWRPVVLFAILQTVGVISWALWISTVAAGVMMMKGRRSSWGPTLAIIAINLIFEAFNFIQGVNGGWFLPMASIAVDIVLFTLVYSLEFHKKVEQKLEAQKVGRTFQAVGSQEFPVQFEGFGNWAKIVGMNESGLFVRPLGDKVPIQIKTRAVELRLAKNLVLKAQFSQMRGDEYFFQFYDLTEETLDALRSWANAVQSVASADQARSVA